MTWALDIAMLGLLTAAWAWRGGCDRILATLALAFAAAAAVGPFLHGMERHVALWLIDAGIVMGMAAAWTVGDNMRAYAIGLIGLGKIGWRLAFAAGLDVSHLAFAVAINVAFALQVLVAGGVLDELGRWIDDRLRVLFPRRYRLLRHVEGA